MLKLPITCKILKDAQYLHPKNHLQSVFGVSDSTTVSEVCDMVRSQWQIYQLQDIPKEWHIQETESAKTSRINQDSYWKNVEKSWLDITPKETEEKSVRIDSYWSMVFEMKSSTGRYHFPQLASFVKAILTLSHGNAGPEQGFSINKAIIDAHGTRVGEDIIIALRRVKHRLLQIGGIVNFEITRPLIESVKLSRSRYEEELKENEQKEASKNKEKNQTIIQ